VNIPDAQAQSLFIRRLLKNVKRNYHHTIAFQKRFENEKSGDNAAYFDWNILPTPCLVAKKVGATQCNPMI
jgi:hypothetical protein